MIEAHAHLAYAPRGAGLLYAMLWFADGPSIYGWSIGSRDGILEASYFVLPDYYAVTPTVLCRSVEDDFHGPWVHDQNVLVRLSQRRPLDERLLT